jgi:hypothetical protein
MRLWQMRDDRVDAGLNATFFVPANSVEVITKLDVAH